MTAPDRLCPPHVLAFSMTATGTSPSRSIVSGSSASSCSSRLAVASPAVPPPTIATPTSMRSSSSSSVRLMNSCCGFTGGGYAAGATRPLPLEPATALALAGLHRFGQLRQDLVEVADDAEVGELEDRRVGVLVDRDDVLRGLHADLVLDRAGDPRREVQLRRDGLARLADLRRVGVPAGVDHRAGRRDGAAQGPREGLERLEALGLAEPATAGHEDVGALDVHVGAALLAALDHRALGRELGELDVDVDDLGVARAGLGRLEGVDPADDDPEVALVLRAGDLRVLEDRPLGDELAALGDHVRDLHGHAALLAGGQAGADLEAEEAAAEQRVLVAVVVDHLGHDVDHRLGEAVRALAAEDLRRAVGAEGLAEVVGEVVAADDDRVRLAADLPGQLRGLGDGAERVLVEGALVVEDVGQDVRHLDQLPLVEPGDDLLDRLVGVLVLDDLARLLRGRVLEVTALHAGAVGAHERGVDAGVAGGLLLERLLLRAHDRLERRVARLVDRVTDGDDRRELDVNRVVAVLGLALAAELALVDVHLDDLRERGHLQVVGDDRADRVALAVVRLLAEQDQVGRLVLEDRGQGVARGRDVGAGED